MRAASIGQPEFARERASERARVFGLLSGVATMNVAATLHGPLNLGEGKSGGREAVAAGSFFSQPRLCT